MPTNRETLLCRYHYDPLGRLAACTLSKQSKQSKQSSIQRFYLKNRLATEIKNSVQRSIFQHDDQLLAQQQRLGGTAETTLLATDQQRSVLNALDATPPHSLAYTPYGHRPPENGLLRLLGFNGERPDPVTGHYLLGNGYRAFNPVLMRFNSPDSWSPFGEGGLNAYAYCAGDPVNRRDPTGHSNWLISIFKGVGNRLGFRTPASARRLAIDTSGSAENAPRQTVSNAATTIVDPPPDYSPPRRRRASVEPRTDDVLASVDEKRLLEEIRRLERSASIQRSFLDDIANGYLPTTSEAHLQRVRNLQYTERNIVQLRQRIPPPNYEKALNTPAPEVPPTYNWAIRNA